MPARAALLVWLLSIAPVWGTLYVTNATIGVDVRFALALEYFDNVLPDLPILHGRLVLFPKGPLPSPSPFLHSVVLIESNGALLMDMKPKILTAQAQGAVAAILRMPDGNRTVTWISLFPSCP